MRLKRPIRTLIYLVLATMFSWCCIYLVEIGVEGAVLFLSPPLSLGFALSISNRRYLRNDLNIVLIPFLFLVVFLYGTLPFSYLGEMLFKNVLGYKLLGCTSAFAFVIAITKFTMKDVTIKGMQILMIICLPIVCIFFESILKNKSIDELSISIVNTRFDLTVLIYQLFMSIAIVSTMKSDKLHKPTNIKSQ